MAISACNKPGYHDIPPEPIFFELVGQNGKSLVSSKNDVVSISYTDNGVTKTFNAGIYQLNASVSDTSASKNYNGLYIMDHAGMADVELGPEPNPAHNFNLALNGVNLGTIYLDYWPFVDAYPKLSTPALTFNGIQAYEDRNAGNFVVQVFQTNK